jgi:hypothetical protein
MISLDSEPVVEYKKSPERLILGQDTRANHNPRLIRDMARITIKEEVPTINPKTGLPYKSPYFKIAWKMRNRERIRKEGREYARENTEKFKENRQRWRNANRERFRENQIRYRAEQRNSDPRFKAEERWRAIWHTFVFKNQSDKTKKNKKYDFGAVRSVVRAHIEAQFEPWMTWENHGEWEIDHINQIKNFDLTIHEEALKAFHYTNTRPIKAEENRLQQHRRVLD